MKNIYLIPTDVPSRLLMTIPKGNLILSKSITSGSHWENQNIYITSDEEIKKKLLLNKTDYYYVKNHYNEWYVGKFNGNSFDFINDNGNFNSNLFVCKKIILTTDQDLINDGVQAIDDTFLEWFVTNPSCEKVKVSELRFFNPDTNESAHCKWEYDLPQEEPKQETLEEAAEKYWAKQPYNQDAFEEGAKWQADRMYSEEDLREAYLSAIKTTGEGWNGEYAEGNDPNIEEKFSEGFTQWFEQFKKK
jgi:hypothetical protein